MHYKRTWSKSPAQKAKHNVEEKLRRERNGGYTEKERENRRLAQQRRRADNPEKTKAEKRLRRLGYNHESAEYAIIISNDPCVYCGSPSDTIDHIFPVIKEGTNHWSNLAPACRSCNASKNDTHLLQYLARTTELPL